jgi:GH15 family glucan-1,4-alpha-glucosidase
MEMALVNDYPAIADHGLIGDLQTSALVATDGTVDWFCLPRFDSPSVFASLLDTARGGRFWIGPEGSDHVSKQLYFPDTAILITRSMSPDGVGEVIDFMPVRDPERVTPKHQLVRIIRVVRGGSTWRANPGSTTAERSTRRSGPRAASSSDHKDWSSLSGRRNRSSLSKEMYEAAGTVAKATSLE